MKKINSGLNIHDVILLLCIIILFLGLRNFHNIFYGNWFIHGDGQTTYLFVENFYKYGDLFLQKGVGINRQYGEILVGYDYLHYGKNFLGLPVKPYGEYYFLGYFFSVFQGLQLFSFIPILNLIGVLFIYLFLTRILECGKKISSLIVIVYMLLPSSIFRNNFLYTNSLSFTLFMGGVYFFFRTNDNPYKIFSLVGGTLLGMSAFMRYEYGIIILLFFLFYTIKILKTKKLLIIGFLLPVLLVPYLNNKYFGDPLEFHYIKKLETKGVISGKKFDNEIMNFGYKLYRRFFVKDFNPNVPRLLKNTKVNFINYFDFLLLFSLLGWSTMFYYNKNKRITILSLLIPFLYIGYNNLGGYHWGEEFDYYITVHSRYIFGLYFFVITGLFVFIHRYIHSKIVILGLIIYMILPYSLETLNGKGGLVSMGDIKRYGRSLNSSVGENDVFVGNVNQKFIIDGYVIPYNNIKIENIKYLVEDLEILQKQGEINNIIVGERKNHKNYKNIGSAIKATSGILVETIEE